MVYKKTGKKSFKKFKKNYKKPKSTTSVTKELSTDIHFYKRSQIMTVSINRGTAVADPTTGNNTWSFSNQSTGGNGKFCLSNLSDYADFTTLYDQYKILGVKLAWYAPANSQSFTTADGGWVADTKDASGLLILHSYNDYDDGVSPTSLNQMVQSPYYKRSVLGAFKPVKRYCKPRSLQMLYDSAVTTGYQLGKKAWVDVTYPDVPHYGIKWMIEEPRSWTVGQDNAYMKLQLVVTYYIQFKDPR